MLAVHMSKPGKVVELGCKVVEVDRQCVGVDASICFVVGFAGEVSLLYVG